MNQPVLYVAIDTPDIYVARERAEAVTHVGDLDTFGFKLNLDLIAKYGFIKTIEQFRSAYRRPIFADMKMWNGGRTMADLAIELGRAGAQLTNMYVQAGDKFMRKVAEAVMKEGLIDVYGVGVLTHYTDAEVRKLYNRGSGDREADLADVVRYLGYEADDAGLHGYIQAGTLLCETYHLAIPRLVPAVRPDWFADTKANDQEQTVTPGNAIRDGARTVVCGSPIFKSLDPADALRKILVEIGAAESDRARAEHLGSAKVRREEG